jgi:hypothetical protein
LFETEGGYRFWPDKVKGEGFLLLALEKKGDNEEVYLPKNKTGKFSTRKWKF